MSLNNEENGASSRIDDLKRRAERAGYETRLISRGDEKVLLVAGEGLIVLFTPADGNKDK